MADFSYADDLELQRLSEQVLAEPQEFENWEKLVRAAEAQEGGLNRNSSPQAIAATRDTYDRFLARFPLFFGYWKKYADLEFAIAGTESAEMVYERGVASVGLSVDLWANYCAFKVETSHDADVIRELYERAADSVGLDFLAHPFWDKYLEFEERLDSTDRIFAILARIIHIPLHQYARYFERFRGMAATRPIAQVVPESVLAGLQEELGGAEKQRAPVELERELRARVDTYLVGVFTATQAETSQRWTFEQEIKRPYYHVTELDDEQLENWRRYLDFEEGKGDYARTKFLYERCLVTCANYEEFWSRYIRWNSAQTSITKEVRNEEVRIIYSRASCIFISIAQPTIRLHYARFEESIGRADTAIAIHEAILANAPGDLETIISLVNTHRRQHGVDAAIKVLKAQLNSGENSRSDRGALVVELARLHWRVKGEVDHARSTFQKQQEHCDSSPQYWVGYFDFELSQPTSLKEEAARHKRIKTLFDHIRSSSKLIKTDVNSFFEVSRRYLGHLLDRGDKEAMQEYIRLDRELNGPPSVRKLKIDAPKAIAANGF